MRKRKEELTPMTQLSDGSSRNNVFALGYFTHIAFLVLNLAFIDISRNIRNLKGESLYLTHKGLLSRFFIA